MANQLFGKLNQEEINELLEFLTLGLFAVVTEDGVMRKRMLTYLRGKNKPKLPSSVQNVVADMATLLASAK